MDFKATLVRSDGTISIIELPHDYADLQWTTAMADEFEVTRTRRNDISAAVRKDGSAVILYGSDGGPHGSKHDCVLPADLASELMRSVLSVLRLSHRV
jgi:hypothetical protein